MIRQTLLLLLSIFSSHNAVSGQNLTLREIIDADPDFSTLGEALDVAQLDLGALSSAVTLFAPTNNAFSKLDSEVLERLLSPGWSAHLVVVLAMHVLDAALPADSLVAGEYEALNGEFLNVTTSGIAKEISSPNTEDSFVTIPETLSSEGVFYEISTVLLPAFVSSTLISIAASDGFSILYELLVLTGLDNLLTSGITATIFAPNDDAFNALGAVALEYYRSNVDVATTLLSGHVVLDLVVPANAVSLGPIELPSAAYETLVFSLEEVVAGSFVYVVNGVEVILPDVLANNGIVHVLSEVLAINGTEVPTTPSPPLSAPVTPPVDAPVEPPVDAPVEPPVDAPIEPPVDAPVDAPAASPIKEPNAEGKGMKKKKDSDKKSKGMDKISKKDKGKGGKGKGSDDSSGKGKGSDDSSGKGKGSESSSGKGKGGESKESKGKGKSPE